MLVRENVEKWSDFDPVASSTSLEKGAYAKFSGAPLKLLKTNNPVRTPSGHLPVLRHEGKKITKAKEIVNYLRQQNYGADFELSSLESSEVLAYISLLEHKLAPALVYMQWVDERNYTEVIHPWFRQNSPFPFNFYVPTMRHRRSQARVAHTVGEHITESKQLEDKVCRDAQQCLNLLTTRLGDEEFFNGDMPAMLDAIVFGYLAPLLKIPLPNNRLQNHLRGCESLCNFVKRVLLRYFPQSPEEMEEERKLKEEQQKRDVEALEFPHRRRNKVLAALFALTAMIGYALVTGIVQVEIVDEDRSGDDELDEDVDFAKNDRDQ
ncbi:PREDICTED: metaxin-1-like [Priapulus caudatus]|uniref:Metaxin-1-like n=1 Tax=Priapulus caudatus TaxID=37621 RepID=A0ABM1DY98_PRICU|nr:PREDICTED: metaxin-1-like [Priapulus caudatus]